MLQNNDNINYDYSKLESHPWSPPLGLFWDQDRHSSRNEFQYLIRLDIEQEKLGGKVTPGLPE